MHNWTRTQLNQGKYKMNRIATFPIPNRYLKVAFVDLGVLAALYLLPAITHLLPVPVYLIDPMRLLLFLTLTTTTRSNAIILAGSMPLLATLFSGHPIFPKNIIIAAELIINVAVFYLLINRTRSILFAGVSAILVSKVSYYLIKFGFLSFGLLEGQLVTTPILYQAVPVILLPVLLVLMNDLKNVWPNNQD